MPALDKVSFRQRVDNLKDDLSADSSELVQRLNEKGVECSIIIPLFEVLLNFDSMRDIQYEYTSDIRYDRFDFLIDNRFIVEAKKLNAPLGARVTAQLEKYIAFHENISYGMLSNGSEYAIFIQKSFIKEFLGPNEKFKIQFEREVFHIMTISIFDDKFFEVIKLFSKDTYHEVFSQLARYVLTRINQTRITKIVDDKSLNKYLYKKIAETMNIQHGAYLKEIQAGKTKPGQKVKFKNDFVTIQVEILNDGRVKLKKGEAKVFDMMKCLASEFAPMIDLVRDEWLNEDYVFNSTDEIIKIATGRERLRRGVYIFK